MSHDRDSKGAPRPTDFADWAVHQATGMVSVQLECSIDDAFRALVDAATERDLVASELARLIVARTTRLVPLPSERPGSVALVRRDGDGLSEVG
jgi:hypothetical protein